jgi:hypothetical protein
MLRLKSIVKYSDKRETQRKPGLYNTFVLNQIPEKVRSLTELICDRQISPQRHKGHKEFYDELDYQSP